MLALACTGATAGAASAVTTVATVDDGSLVVIGTDGDDDIALSTPATDPSQVPQEVDVDDPAGLAAGAGCVQATPTRATCSQIVSVLVAGAHGDDTLTAGENLCWSEFYGQAGSDTITGALWTYGGAGPDHLTGGADAILVDGEDGDDDLSAGSGSTNLIGGPGDDELTGGPGDDMLWGDEGDDVLRGERPSAATAAASGADVFSGGEGTDIVDYGGRTDPLTVTLGIVESDALQGYANDGAAGEQDELFGVEDVRGGAGDDHLTGGGGPNRLVGGPGDDVVDGGGGADVLAGDDDGDGTAMDPLLGGADVLLARDGVADKVRCGAGNDAVEVDPLDVLVAGAGCEQVTVAEYVPPPPPPAPPGSGDPGAGTDTSGSTPSAPPGDGRLPYLPPGPGWVPRPPKPPAPVVLRRRRAVGHGKARVTVHVIPRGTLTATASATVDGRTLVIARGRAVALSNRDVTVTLRATAAGRRVLRTHHSLTVGLRLRLAPHAGTRIVTLSGGAFRLRW